MSVLAVESDSEFPSVDDSYAVTHSGYLAVVERGETGWGAYVPDLPGVVAAAGSEAEARALISEAVEFHIEGLRTVGEPVPEPSSGAHWVVEDR